MTNLLQAGATKFRCPELDLEPEIWVPAPQPWYALQRTFWRYHCSL